MGEELIEKLTLINNDIQNNLKPDNLKERYKLFKYKWNSKRFK